MNTGHWDHSTNSQFPFHNPNCKSSKAIIKHNDIKQKETLRNERVNLERKILLDESHQWNASRPHQWPC